MSEDRDADLGAVPPRRAVARPAVRTRAVQDEPGAPPVRRRLSHTVESYVPETEEVPDVTPAAEWVRPPRLLQEVEGPTPEPAAMETPIDLPVRGTQPDTMPDGDAPDLAPWVLLGVVLGTAIVAAMIVAWSG